MALAAIASGAGELCVANLHATAGDRHQAEEDIMRGAREAIGFADGRPLVFGGDLNVRPRTSYMAVVRNPNTTLEPASATNGEERG